MLTSNWRFHQENSIRSRREAIHTVVMVTQAMVDTVIQDMVILMEDIEVGMLATLVHIKVDKLATVAMVVMATQVILQDTTEPTSGVEPVMDMAIQVLPDTVVSSETI